MKNLTKRLLLSAFMLNNFNFILFAEANNEVELEEIVVYGIRSSINDSLTTKQNSSAILDAISSEEIGKFPDKNVAESLSRIPGIVISRDFGEGQGLTVRGIQSSYNITQLNGQSLGTAQWYSLSQSERNFNYEILSSEMISKLEVYKSSQADLDEGALGATIILHTQTPLDLPTNTFSASLGMHNGSMSSKKDPSGSFIYSWKNEEETFGILVAASLQNRTVHREGTEVFGFLDPSDASLNDTFSAPLHSTQRGIIPFAMGSALFKQDRERIGTNITAQWKPTENLTTTLNYFTSKLNANNQNQNFYSFVSRGLNNTSTPLSGTVQNGIVTSLDVDPSSAVFDNIYRDGSKMQTDALNLKVAHENDNGLLVAQIGQTTGKGTNVDDIYQFTPYNLKESSNFGFHGSTAGARIDYTSNDWILDPSDEMALSKAKHIRTKTQDKEKYAQLDYSYYLTNNFFNELKFGLKYRDRSYMQNRNATSLYNGILGTAGDFKDGTYTVNHTTSHGSVTTFDLDENKMNHAFTNLPDCQNTSAGTLCKENKMFRHASFNIEEKITSFYGMANFENDSYYGNIGVRFVTTDTTSNAYDLNVQTLTPTSEKSNYSDWLPSFNLAYRAKKDLLVRFSASKIITRPAIYQLSSAVTLNSALSSGSGGNPELNPLSAYQYEVSTEWYYKKKSLLSLALFYKDINSFIYNSVAPEIINGTYFQHISRPRNGSSIALKGVELNLNHALTDNMGISSNYTYTDIGSITVKDILNNIPTYQKIKFPLSSKHAYNFSLYYENATWSSRLSYNYRSKFFKYASRAGEYWGKAQEQVDAKIIYHLDPKWSFSIEALNLSNENIEETYVSPSGKEITSNQWSNGRSFYMGLDYKF
jgi:iron complex outermembrane receptor protein